MKAFSGRLYRPDVAPADAAVHEPAPPAAPARDAQTGDGRAVDVKTAITNPLFETVKGRSH